MKLLSFYKSQSVQRILFIVFEIAMGIIAIIYLLPVILAFINSFKSNSEIQMNISSLPHISLKVPKKIKQNYFDGMIINRLSSQADRDYFLSCYNYKQGTFSLKKDTEKLKNLEKTYKIKFKPHYTWDLFTSEIIQNVSDYNDKDLIRSHYRYNEGLYTLKKQNMSNDEKNKLISILKSNNVFKTLKENFKINYSTSWKETNFPTVFFNTLIITLFSTLGILLISSMAAYALVRTDSRASWLFFLIFTFAMVVPFQAIMFPLVRTAKILNLLGTYHGIILIYMGVGCPMAIFMYHGFIKGVPKELEESASIDGANQFTIFFRIVLPLLTPITATLAILNVLWLWNDFLLPLIITMKKIVTIQLAQYYTRGAYSRDMGMELASLVLASLPVIIFYLFMQKYIIKGITAGAVKG